MTGRRWTLFEHNLAGKGVVVEGGYLPSHYDISYFRVDESERTIIGVVEVGHRALVVQSIEEGRLLWKFSGVSGNL